MLLTIDAGNTNTVFALFDGETLAGSWRAATNAHKTADEYAAFLKFHLRENNHEPKAIKHAIIGSVVPEANFNLARFCRNHLHCEPLIVGAAGVEVGIKILLDRPEEVGADRIINAVGGLQNYAPPFLVIDFGTATTFDVIDENGDYRGGAIAPGVNLALQALHMAAAKLPRIGIAPPKNVIGTNTVEAIRSGVFLGYASLIEGMIQRIRQELGQPLRVIATGGLSRMFENGVINGIENFDQELTLRGLHKIFHLNHKA